MNQYKYRLQRGIAQLPIILGLVLLGVALPAVMKLAQENQDKRSSAAYDVPCKQCNRSTEKCEGTGLTGCSNLLNECSSDSQCLSAANKKCDGADPGTRRCKPGSKAVQVCDAGQWKGTGTTCADKCENGECVTGPSGDPENECNPGATKCCNDRKEKRCNNHGVWGSCQACSSGWCDFAAGKCKLKPTNTPKPQPTNTPKPTNVPALISCTLSLNGLCRGAFCAVGTEEKYQGDTDCIKTNTPNCCVPASTSTCKNVGSPCCTRRDIDGAPSKYCAGDGSLTCGSDDKCCVKEGSYVGLMSAGDCCSGRSVFTNDPLWAKCAGCVPNGQNVQFGFGGCCSGFGKALAPPSATYYTCMEKPKSCTAEGGKCSSFCTLGQVKVSGDTDCISSAVNPDCCIAPTGGCPYGPTETKPVGEKICGSLGTPLLTGGKCGEGEACECKEGGWSVTTCKADRESCQDGKCVPACPYGFEYKLAGKKICGNLGDLVCGEGQACVCQNDGTWSKTTCDNTCQGGACTCIANGKTTDNFNKCCSRYGDAWGVPKLGTYTCTAPKQACSDGTCRSFCIPILETTVHNTECGKDAGGSLCCIAGNRRPKNCRTDLGGTCKSSCGTNETDYDFTNCDSNSSAQYCCVPDSELTPTPTRVPNAKTCTVGGYSVPHESEWCDGNWRKFCDNGKVGTFQLECITGCERINGTAKTRCKVAACEEGIYKCEKPGPNAKSWILYQCNDKGGWDYTRECVSGCTGGKNPQCFTCKDYCIAYKNYPGDTCEKFGIGTCQGGESCCAKPAPGVTVIPKPERTCETKQHGVCVRDGECQVMAADSGGCNMVGYVCCDDPRPNITPLPTSIWNPTPTGPKPTATPIPTEYKCFCTTGCTLGCKWALVRPGGYNSCADSACKTAKPTTKPTATLAPGQPTEVPPGIGEPTDVPPGPGQPTSPPAGNKCKLCPDGSKIKKSPDYNCDGKINMEDFAGWFDEFVLSKVKYADFNCDGKVDLKDFGMWYDEFTKGAN
ncbi:MAG: hypothetical protein ABID04_00480 [Patescibacteria group bacterium]